MPDDEPERLEDYQELEQVLTNLQAGKAAALPKGLTPEKARLCRMALLFHAATPGASELRPEFAARLGEELRASEIGKLPLRSSSPSRSVTRRRRLVGTLWRQRRWR